MLEPIKIDHRKIIESYGNIAIFRYYDNKLSVSVTLVNHQVSYRILAIGNDLEEAISKLYDKLHYSIKDTVEIIEDN